MSSAGISLRNFRQLAPSYPLRRAGSWSKACALPLGHEIGNGMLHAASIHPTFYPTHSVSMQFPLPGVSPLGPPPAVRVGRRHRLRAARLPAPHAREEPPAA